MQKPVTFFANWMVTNVGRSLSAAMPERRQSQMLAAASFSGSWLSNQRAGSCPWEQPPRPMAAMAMGWPRARPARGALRDARDPQARDRLKQHRRPLARTPTWS